MENERLLELINSKVDKIQESSEKIREDQRQIKTDIALINNKIDSIEKELEDYKSFKKDFEKNITVQDILNLQTKVEKLEQFKVQALAIFTTVQAIVGIALFFLKK